MAKKLFARQGDVLIFKVGKRRKKMEEVKEFVLREGEVTGHKHVLVKDRPETKIRISRDERGYYIEVLGGNAKIVHEEHLPITLEPGNYFVSFQREYDPLEYQRSIQD